MPLEIQIYIYINIFIIGTLFGSFFTLASYRLPRKMDIVKSRSICPNCKHELGFFDLIPILSYTFSGGKCRYCKEKISIRYPLFELFNGIVFVLLYYVFNFSIYYIFAIILYSLFFLNTSYYIMKRKLILGEIENLKTKKGVFVLEIIVAFIFFVSVIGMTFVTTSNIAEKNIYTTAKNNAYLTGSKYVEVALATEYNSLNSFNVQEEVDGIVYYIDVNVEKYSDYEVDRKDYIKEIYVIVRYNFDGQSQMLELSTLKKKVL